MDGPVPCSACGAPSRRDPYFYRWRDRVWWIRRCTDCTLQFVHPPVTMAERSAIFDEKYFSAEGDWACGRWGTSYEEAEGELRAEARRVLEMLGDPAGGRLLDVGCAGGTFLDEARAAGWEVAGIEFNAEMAERATGRGLPVWNGPVESAPRDLFDEPFDTVVIMDTLEHIPSPRAVLERVRAWTRPGGVLLIRGPLNDDPLAQLREMLRRLAGAKKQLPGYPLDANTWNRRALARLVEAHGFRVRAWTERKRDFANLLADRC